MCMKSLSTMPQSRNSVFVRNLDTNTSDIDFLYYFKTKYAGVISGKILRDLCGRSKGCGFINCKDSMSVSQIILHNNHVINGKIIVCKKASSKKKSEQNVPKNFQKKEPKYMRELYVGNLDKTTTNQQLNDYFQKFGTIVNTRIIFDENKKSKSYGFVEFQTSSSVEQVQENRPHKINNREAQTVRTYPKSVPSSMKKPTTTLYVLKYGERVDEEKDIEEYFSQFGDITMVSLKVKRPENVKFVELQFDDYDAVDTICLADRHTINGSPVTVSKYIEDDLEKLMSTRNPAQNASESTISAKKSTPRTTDAHAKKKPTVPPRSTVPPRPTAPPPPSQDLYQNAFNPHFVNPSAPLYPSLGTIPINSQYTPSTTWPSNSPHSQTITSGSRLRKNNNSCCIS